MIIYFILFILFKSEKMSCQPSLEFLNTTNDYLHLKPINTADGYLHLLRTIDHEELKKYLREHDIIDTDDKIKSEKNFFAKVLSGQIPNYPNRLIDTINSLREGTDELASYFKTRHENTCGCPVKEKYFVAINLPEHDKNWESNDVHWVGKASMSKFHQFLLIKDLNWKYFNALAFDTDMLPIIKEMKEVATNYAKSQGVENVGLYFHVYPHTTIQCLHLHIIDLDNVGPSYHALQYKNLSIDDVIETLRDLQLISQVD